MVVMVATKVMVIKAVMVAIRAMDKVAMVATRLTVVTKAMAMKAMVATKAMAMRGMVATKAMAVSLIRDTANKVMASRRDMVRTKVTAINKAVMATASSKAPNTNNSLATARTKVPSTSKGLATPSNRRSNTITITAENTRRTPATSLPSRTVKRELGTPWIWRRTPTAARATAIRINTEVFYTLP